MSNSSSNTDSPVAGEDAFAFSSGTQQPCPDCGEMVRSGVVRCWNCGAFMDPEVEAKFLKMQEKPPAVLYSDPAMAEEQTPPDATADDNGDEPTFELNTGGGGSTFGLQLPETPVNDDSDGEASVAMGTPTAEGAGTAKPPEPAAAPEPEDDPLMASIMSDLKTQAARESDTLAKFKGGVRTAGGFIIFCPYGCTIEVKDKHRGNIGKCPKCEAPFTVPVNPPNYKKAAAAAAAAASPSSEAPAAGGFGKYALWIEDARLHKLPPDKLKLKEDAHAKDFQKVDLAMSGEEVVLLPLAAKGGLFGGGGKPDELRTNAQELAAAGQPADSWIEGGHPVKFSKEALGGFKVVAPLPPDRPSIFQNVAVFGVGRIIVQLPNATGVDEPMYLSLGVTQFRKLAEAMATMHSRDDLAEGLPIPMKDETFTHTCHYTDVKIHALQNLEFYAADESVELVVAGWQCEHCGLTVSEDGRKKEGLGGKNGKGIAKAKCPKCEEKMGNKPLETRKEMVQSAEMAT